MSNAMETVPSTPKARRPLLRSMDADHQNAVSAALEAYAREQQEALGGHGPALRMSTADGERSYLTSIIGSSGQQVLIIAAPKDAGGRVADLGPGQHWVFRTIHYTTALRFEGVVKRVVDDAAPHVYVELTGEIQRRVVRKAARVAVSIRA